ncbi:hypothetical protein ACFQ07_16365, partial [Actinomadura adrarensis]
DHKRTHGVGDGERAARACAGRPAKVLRQYKGAAVSATGRSARDIGHLSIVTSFGALGDALHHEHIVTSSDREGTKNRRTGTPGRRISTTRLRTSEPRR